jgi:hypothetical protein
MSAAHTHSSRSHRPEPGDRFPAGKPTFARARIVGPNATRCGRSPARVISILMELVREQEADQIFGRREWWRCGEATFLVSFHRDDSRCSVFVSAEGVANRAEELFYRLGLHDDAALALGPAIDCYAISCPADQVGPLLQKLASALA